MYIYFLDLTRYISDKDISSIKDLLIQNKFEDIINLIVPGIINNKNNNDKDNNNISDNESILKKFQKNFEKQIILTILIFCLIKTKKYVNLYETFKVEEFKFEETIFSLKFLEAKYYFLTVNIFYYNL